MPVGIPRPASIEYPGHAADAGDPAWQRARADARPSKIACREAVAKRRAQPITCICRTQAKRTPVAITRSISASAISGLVRAVRYSTATPATGAGGEVRYDPLPSIRYRTHSHNVFGANVGWRSRINRLQMLKAGDFEHWSALNIAALERFRSCMTPENRSLYNLFCESRKGGFFGRQLGFLQAGVYRQTLLGNMGLAVAMWTKRI